MIPKRADFRRRDGLAISFASSHPSTICFVRPGLIWPLLFLYMEAARQKLGGSVLARVLLVFKEPRFSLTKSRRSCLVQPRDGSDAER